MTEIVAQKSIEELQKLHAPTQITTHKKANFLIGGNSGSGKTHLLQTARKPVWIHSFDPDGSLTIRDKVDNKSIIVDTRFENENPKDPKIFTLFDKVFDNMLHTKVFEQIGTYALDSATTLGDCVMYWVLKAAGRIGQPPWENDYPQQMSRMSNIIRTMCSLPCDVILTCHLSVEKDQISGRMHTVPILTGKLREKIPILFSEQYCMVTEPTPTGTEYKLLTQPDGHYTAKTRLGTGGRLKKWEEPNITNILRKVGIE